MDLKNKYILVHYIENPLKTKIQKVINKIMNNFNVFDMSGIDPHFTLKYYFEEKYLEDIQNICEDISKTHQTGFFQIQNTDNFYKNTIFLNIELDKNSKLIYEKLFNQMKLKKIPFEEHEKEGIHFHITLAQDASNNFSEINQLIQEEFNEQEFNNHNLNKQEANKQKAKQPNNTQETNQLKNTQELKQTIQKTKQKFNNLTILFFDGDKFTIHKQYFLE